MRKNLRKVFGIIFVVLMIFSFNFNVKAEEVVSEVTENSEPEVKETVQDSVSKEESNTVVKKEEVKNDSLTSNQIGNLSIPNESGKDVVDTESIDSKKEEVNVTKSDGDVNTTVNDDDNINDNQYGDNVNLQENDTDKTELNVNTASENAEIEEPKEEVTPAEEVKETEKEKNNEESNKENKEESKSEEVENTKEEVTPTEEVKETEKEKNEKNEESNKENKEESKSEEVENTKEEVTPTEEVKETEKEKNEESNKENKEESKSEEVENTKEESTPNEEVKETEKEKNEESNKENKEESKSEEVENTKEESTPNEEVKETEKEKNEESNKENKEEPKSEEVENTKEESTPNEEVKETEPSKDEKVLPLTKAGEGNPTIENLDDSNNEEAPVEQLHDAGDIEDLTTFNTNITNGQEISVDELLAKVGLNLQASDIKNVESSDPTKIEVAEGKIVNKVAYQEPVTITLVDNNDKEYIITVDFAPDHSKGLIDNEDGTYTISLDVTGESITTKPNHVNVVVVLDTSYSMRNTYAGGVDGNQETITENTHYYTPSDETRARMYGIIDGTFVEIARGADNKYYDSNNVEYKGQRYINDKILYDSFDPGVNMNPSAPGYPNVDGENTNRRIFAAKYAVQKLALDLLSRNGVNGADNDTVEMALVTFDRVARIDLQPTTNLATFLETVSKLVVNKGTNWEAALRAARTINFNDNDTTFLVFVTDGNPTNYMHDSLDDDVYTGTYTTTSGTVIPVNSQLGGATVASNSQIQGDGNESGNGTVTNSYNASKDEVLDVVQDKNYKFYSIGAYGLIDNLKRLTSYGYYADNNPNNDTTVDEVHPVEAEGKFFNATSTSALNSAFDSILEAIKTTGFGSVNINDGVTSSVEATSGSVSGGLLDVDDTTFKYYFSFPVTENTDGTLTSNIDYITSIVKSGDDYLLTNKNGKTVIVKRVTAYDFDSNGVQNKSKVLTNVFKFEWSNNNNPFHLTNNQGKPVVSTDEEGKPVPAEYIVNDSVVWNLSELGVLIDGVTYTVTFDCWPSQATLDLIADLKNGKVVYDDLKEDIRKYLGRDYNLKTNTGASLSFKDTRVDDTTSYSSDYDDPAPVPTYAVRTFAIAKEWVGTREEADKSITLYVDRDGSTDPKRYEINLHENLNNSEDHYKGSVYISLGIMRVDNEGNIDIKDPGHDYSFSEDIDVSWRWELKADTVRPMLINNVVTTLILLDDEPTATWVGDYGSGVKTVDGESKDVKYYRFTTCNTVDGQETCSTKYYEVGPIGEAVLTARNERRTQLDVKKAISNGADGDASLFTYEATIITGDDDNYNDDEDYWFSIWDTNNKTYIMNGNTSETTYITNATAEVKTVDTNDEKITSVTVDEADKKITITYSDGTTKTDSYMTLTHNGTVYSYTTGYYFAKSGTKVIIKLQGGTYKEVTGEDGQTTTELVGAWSLRFLNLPTGSRYTISETNMNQEYSFKELGVKYRDSGSNNDMVDNTITISGENNDTVSGRVSLANKIYTVLYTNEVEETNITVIKVWDGPETQDGVERPESIDVKLYEKIGNGEEKVHGEAVTLNGNGNWKTTWEHLPLYINGERITYRVEEVLGGMIVGESTPGKYYYTLTKNSDGSYTVTNTYIPEVTKVTVTKKWSDNANQDGTQPSSINVQLYKGGVAEGRPVTLNEGNRWTYTWNNLEKNSNGNPISYTVEEVVEGLIAGLSTVNEKEEGKYYYSISQNEDGSYTITNEYVPLTTDLTVKKVWEDNNNHEGFRPESVTFQLKADGENYGDPVTVTFDKDLSENEWAYTFENLDVYKDGKKIVYTVVELNVPEKYTKTEADLIVTNKREIEKTEVTVKKIWKDNDNQEGFRPEEITIELFANGEKIKEAKVSGKDNEWTYTFENLDKYADGKEIKYTIKEIVVENYETEINDFEITNSREVEKTNVTIKKIWKDNDNQEGFRPEEITVELFANGEKIKEAKVSGKDNEWTYTFENLDKYADGKEIKYTINEVEVENYETEINGFEITNSREVEKTNVTIKKVWDDNNNQDGIRPENLVVTLNSGDKVTLNEENNWTATITDLPVYANGEKIEYTWTENDVEGYKITDTKVEGYVTTITNYHKPEVIEISVLKDWIDDNNEKGLRPETVIITLLANGKYYDEYKFNAKENWSHVFSNLPKYMEGEEIEYSVLEENVPNDYVVSYEGDSTNGFIVHNGLGKGDIEPPTPPHINPQTGDNIALYLITLLISIVSFITGKVYLKKYED